MPEEIEELHDDAEHAEGEEHLDQKPDAPDNVNGEQKPSAATHPGAVTKRKGGAYKLEDGQLVKQS